MNKLIISPDKFKGTLSAPQICDIVEKAFKAEFPALDVIKLPIADGGDGTAQCFLSRAGARKIPCHVHDPFGKPLESFFVMLGDTAVIETALYAGLALVGENKNPLTASTYGVGEAASAAIKNGAKKIVFALGGSATNDMACGLLAAMGMKFTDKNGTVFLPVGDALCDIADYDTEKLLENTRGVEFEVMCDIDNPLYGPNGAAYVFAPQKGADTSAVQKLDDGLKHLSDLFTRKSGRDISRLAGAGAAGGMGGGLCAFMNATLKSGIEAVLDIFGFDGLLDGCDMVITGEGRLDSQTLGGKVICGVGKRCKAAGVPLVAICGDTFSCPDEIYSIGVTGVFSINTSPLPFEEAKPLSERNLAATAKNIAKLIAASER